MTYTPVYPWRVMQVGDYFTAPWPKYHAVRQCITRMNASDKRKRFKYFSWIASDGTKSILAVRIK